MKYEILQGEDKKQEETVQFYLRDNGFGEVLLCAKIKGDDHPAAPNLLTINRDGSFARNHCVNSKLGLTLDTNGRIVIE